METPSIPEWPGARRVGRYVLYDAIAVGGMASVHLARQHGAVGFSRIVAIKCIHPHIAREPDFVAMFLDEARLASRVRHANVVSPLDVVTEGGEVFLVLEYIAGESLAHLLDASRLAGEPVPLDVASRIVSDVLHGLQAAHEARDEQGRLLHLVHRDVSPHNILVGVDGASRVADFGVAKAVGRLQTTRSGQLKGKLGYMAPEQLKGERVSPRSDVYSTGVTLWELLAGRRLIDADTEAELVLKSVAGPLPALREFRSDLPTELYTVVERAIQRDPRQRYESALAFAEAIEAIAPTASPRTMSRWVMALANDSLETRAELVSAIERQVGLPSSRPPSPTSPQEPGGSLGRPPQIARPADRTPLGLARSSSAPRARSLHRRGMFLGVALIVAAGAAWLYVIEPVLGESSERDTTSSEAAAASALPGERGSLEAAVAPLAPAPKQVTSQEVLSEAGAAPDGAAHDVLSDDVAQQVADEPVQSAPAPPRVRRPAPPSPRPQEPERSPVVPDDLLGRH